MEFSFFGETIKNELDSDNEFYCKYKNIIITAKKEEYSYSCYIKIKNTDFEIFSYEDTIQEAIQDTIEELEIEIQNLIYDFKKTMNILSNIPNLEEKENFYCTSCGCKMLYKLQ
jgi:hypothetical protein